MPQAGWHSCLDVALRRRPRANDEVRFLGIGQGYANIEIKRWFEEPTLDPLLEDRNECENESSACDEPIGGRAVPECVPERLRRLWL